MFYLAFLFLAVLYLCRKRINRTTVIIGAVIPMVYIIIRRYGVGADYFSYQLLYDNMIVSNFGNIFESLENIDVGFKILMYISKNIGLSFHAFFAITNTSIVLLFSYVVWKYSDEVSVSMFLFYAMFYVVWGLSGVRQGLAMGLGLIVLFKTIYDQNSKGDVGILVLAYLMHSSAIIILVLILISKIKWNKMQHLVLVIISILISHFNLVYVVMSKIPALVNHRIITVYLSNDFKVFDFPGIIRILIFIVVWLFYDLISKDKIKKSIVDIFLFGFSMYFVLKFSEITASRLSSYTYILAIFIAPILLDALLELCNESKFISRTLSIIVVVFGFIYFQKEMQTMNVQSGMNQQNFFVKMPTIENSTLLDFDNYSTVQLYINKMTKDNKADYLSKVNRQSVPYIASDKYLIVKDYSIQKNRIINQNGDFLGNYGFDYDVEIKESILKYYSYTADSLAQVAVYSDISGRNLTNEQMMDIWLRETINEELFQPLEYNIDFSVDNLPKELKDIFRYDSSLELLLVNRINEPFEYHIGIAKYYGVNIYFYLDANYNLLINQISFEPIKYDKNGFLKMQTFEGEVTFNSEGNITWWK